jgi:hypothetical protein
MNFAETGNLQPVTKRPQGMCHDCAHFDSSPLMLERAFPGFAAMGSGFSSVKSGDGLCVQHSRYVSSTRSCDKFRTDVVKPIKAS